MRISPLVITAIMSVASLCCAAEKTMVHESNCATAAEAGADSLTAPASLKVQETCPVMGNPINKELFVDAGGKRFYLCCAGCGKSIKKKPAKYIDILENR